MTVRSKVDEFSLQVARSEWRPAGPGGPRVGVGGQPTGAFLTPHHQNRTRVEEQEAEAGRPDGKP